ncbi:hypothetical protein Q1695_009254 [Nippostrongylus brasiliensis]|nr:hypothetical protein Q1695_009254 [Nippostrongylus brasiliensis]
MVTSNWTKRLWGPNAHQLSTDTIVATPSSSNRPFQLPPLIGMGRPKRQLASISAIDFDIPQLERSPSVHSTDSPQALTPVPNPSSAEAVHKHDAASMQADDISDIESLTGIDQLLESDRSGSISF